MIPAEISTLAEVINLLDITRNPDMSDKDKQKVREIWRTKVTYPAKVYYNDFYDTLSKQEQEAIKNFWGF